MAESLALEFVKHELLSYLERRPTASDTLDGIVNWWLHEQRIANGKATVSAAVHELVSEGQLHERKVAQDVTLYCKSPVNQPPVS